MKKIILTVFFIACSVTLFGQVPVNQSTKVDGLRPTTPSQSAPNIITPIIGKDKKPTTPAAQNCTCNPNSFGFFQYTYPGTTMTVQSLQQFEVQCNTPITLNGSYKCNYTTVCDVQLKATIKTNDPSPTLVKTYDNFTFPWNHQFENAGNYVLEITPFCDGRKCESVKFYFRVLCDKPTICKCRGKEGWNKFTAYIDKVATKAKCGDNFTLNIKQQFGLEGGYKCEGNCDVTLKGQLINGTTGEEQNFPNVNLSGLFTFPAAGEYKLILSPICSKEICDTCVFYINVKK
jgi:hypothetical protein